MSREWLDACCGFFLACCFHNCIVSFVIVCYGFVVVAGVWSLHVFLTSPFLVLYSMHLIPLIIVCHLVFLVLHPRPVTSG